MKDEAERIAAGLTEAQRADLLSAKPPFDSAYPVFTPDKTSGKELADLIAKDLVWFNYRGRKFLVIDDCALEVKRILEQSRETDR